MPRLPVQTASQNERAEAVRERANMTDFQYSPILGGELHGEWPSSSRTAAVLTVSDGVVGGRPRGSLGRRRFRAREARVRRRRRATVPDERARIEGRSGPGWTRDTRGSCSRPAGPVSALETSRPRRSAGCSTGKSPATASCSGPRGPSSPRWLSSPEASRARWDGCSSSCFLEAPKPSPRASKPGPYP